MVVVLMCECPAPAHKVSTHGCSEQRHFLARPAQKLEGELSHTVLLSHASLVWLASFPSKYRPVPLYSCVGVVENAIRRTKLVGFTPALQAFCCTRTTEGRSSVPKLIVYLSNVAAFTGQGRWAEAYLRNMRWLLGSSVYFYGVQKTATELSPATHSYEVNKGHKKIGVNSEPYVF